MNTKGAAMVARFNRRQAAREAFYAAAAEPGEDGPNAFEAGIRAATRVKITPDLINLANDVQEKTPGLEVDQMHAALTAAFRAAGFEVVE